MCYPKPGPRCSGHTRNELLKATAALTADRSTINLQRYARALHEYHSSPAGIQELREQLLEAVIKGDDTEQLVAALAEGERSRDVALASLKASREEGQALPFDGSAEEQEAIEQDASDTSAVEGLMDIHGTEGFEDDLTHSSTGHIYDETGFSVYNTAAHLHPGTDISDGVYDENGYDENGFNRFGRTADDSEWEEYVQQGKVVDGYDKDGFDSEGFDRFGLHVDTGDEYDRYGVDREGFNRNGWFVYPDRSDDPIGFVLNRNGSLYGSDGYDVNGFDVEGVHRSTDTVYSPDGLDRFGFNRDGFISVFHSQHHPYTRVDQMIHKTTGTYYAPDGYDHHGFDAAGFNASGLNSSGFNRDGFNGEGYNAEGFNREGFNRHGLDSKGYDAEGFDGKGFNRSRVHRSTGTVYSPEGVTVGGLSREGVFRTGEDPLGFTANKKHSLSSVRVVALHNVHGSKVKKDKHGVPIRNLAAEGWTHKFGQGFNPETGTYVSRDTFTHKDTGTAFNPEGFDVEGVNVNNITERGFDTRTKLHTNGTKFGDDGWDYYKRVLTIK